MRKDSELQKRALLVIVYFEGYSGHSKNLGNGELFGEKFHTPVIQFPNLLLKLWNAKFAIWGDSTTKSGRIGPRFSDLHAGML